MNSLEKALDLLELIYLHGGKMTLAKLTKLSGLNKSTVYRILNTFVRKQILNKDPITAEYFLPNKAFQLNLLHENTLSLYSYCQEIMYELSTLYDTAVNLSVLDIQGIPLDMSQEDGKFIRTVEQYKKQVRTNILLTGQQCQESDVFQPSVYLCFMAFGDVEAGSDEYLENYFKLNKRRLKPQKTYDLFQAEIRQIKMDGYACCQDDYQIGCTGLAFPIVDDQNVIMASLSLSFKNTDLAKIRLETLINQMKKATKSISYQWALDASKNN